MRQNFTKKYLWLILFALAIGMNYSFAAGPRLRKKAKQDTTNYFLTSKKPKKKSILSFSLPPFKPGSISTAKVTVPAGPNDRLLSNVEVYPNPITDQINLKYIISRNSNVHIKILDILGNSITTLFSQRVEPGEQVLNYPLNNKLSRGFYFIRVDAGTENVIKRISVL